VAVCESVGDGDSISNSDSRRDSGACVWPCVFCMGGGDSTSNRDSGACVWPRICVRAAPRAALELERPIHSRMGHVAAACIADLCPPFTLLPFTPTRGGTALLKHVGGGGGERGGGGCAHITTLPRYGDADQGEGGVRRRAGAKGGEERGRRRELESVTLRAELLESPSTLPPTGTYARTMGMPKPERRRE